MRPKFLSCGRRALVVLFQTSWKSRREGRVVTFPPPFLSFATLLTLGGSFGSQLVPMQAVMALGYAVASCTAVGQILRQAPVCSVARL